VAPGASTAIMPVWIDLSGLGGNTVDAAGSIPSPAHTFVQRYHKKGIKRFYWSQNPGEQTHTLALSSAGEEC
jgi:hypothetical protein